MTQSCGMDLAAYAQESPQRVYWMLIGLSSGIPALGLTGVYVDSEQALATTVKDGIEATQGVAKTAVERLALSHDIFPIDVVVSIWQKQSFRDTMRLRRTKPKDAFTFRIESPDLT